MEPQVITILFMLVGTAVFVAVQAYLNAEQLDFSQATVIRTYLSSGTSACVFSLHGNIDSDQPCAYHIGDNVTVYHNGVGIWRIKQ